VSAKVTEIGYLELCPSSCCSKDPYKRARYVWTNVSIILYVPYFVSINYKQIEARLDQGFRTYKYWRALRFAKEGDISQFRPLKDMFLHRANIKRISLSAHQYNQYTICVSGKYPRKKKCLYIGVKPV
jgi:hypothetical protein